MPAMDLSLKFRVIDKYDTSAFVKAVREMGSAGAPYKYVRKYLDSIYDITDDNDLYFLAWSSLAYSSEIFKNLAKDYDSLRKDDFTGWDAPVTYGYTERTGEQKISESGLPMPNRAKLYDESFIKTKEANPDIPLVSICMNSGNSLAALRLTVESIFRMTQGMDYILYISDTSYGDGDTQQDIAEYIKRIPGRVSFHKRSWDTEAGDVEMAPFGKLHGIINESRYRADIIVGTVLPQGWLEKLITVIRLEENAACVHVCKAWNTEVLRDIDKSFLSPEEISLFSAKQREQYDYYEETFSFISDVTVYAQELGLLVGGDDVAVFDHPRDYFIRIRQNGLKILRDHSLLCYNPIQGYNGNPLSVCRFHDDKLLEKHRAYDENIFVLDEKFIIENIWNNGYNSEEEAYILGCGDSECFHQLLHMKNRLQRAGARRIYVFGHAYDTQEYPFLRLFCDDVTCGDNERMISANITRRFDAIYVHKPINSYAGALSLVAKLIGLLKPGGGLYIHYENPFSTSLLLEEKERTPLFDMAYIELLRAVNAAGGTISDVDKIFDRSKQSAKLAMALNENAREIGFGNISIRAAAIRIDANLGGGDN